MPYPFMYSALEWQREQVSATFKGFTLDRVSLAGRRSCTPWQSTHTATLASPLAKSCPCTLVLYCENWSVRKEGLYLRMKAPSEWQRPQKSGTFLRSILPRNPAALLMASMSALVGSPPWQLEQVRPFWKWISLVNCCSVTWRGGSRAPWQSKHVFCACA